MAEQNHQVPDAQDAQNEQKAPQEKPRYIKIHRVIIGVKPGYILRKIGEAYMVMPTGPRMKEYQGMITLNETGAFLFQESQKPNPTVHSLQQACREKYGATEEEAKQAVDAFVRQCGQCGLFEVETVTVDTQEGKVVDENA
ncbi:MAG: PqqD family protein [Christensenellales bacterium]|uniref:PqqD family protein n=1 Tax=Candidatus Avichristensenella intestinipullorum TaxID=2840693 RepID=A0A9D0YX84_9FIRM|nr:PqqD family protein [Christensenellales bacterium]HIQ63520.1 PqqD family protein [Candidatus Avichristensenella intestinipullorum]